MPRVFGTEDAGAAVLAAVERRGLVVHRAGDGAAAAVMAAVTGALETAPGALAVGAGAIDGADLVPVLQYARRDCAPLIVVSERSALAPASAAAPGAVESVVKARLDIGAGSASHWIAHAAQLAMADPRGPVWLDLDPEVARASALPVATSCRPAPLPPPDPARLEAAARRLAAAARPVLIVGVQCRGDGSGEWLRAFAEARPAPVLVTRAAKGVVPDPHPLCLGLFAGDVAGNPLLARADLVVAVGVEAVELTDTSWPVRAPVLHVGRSPHGGAVWRPELEVVGEIAATLEELAPRLRGQPAADWDVAELDRIKRDARARVAAGPARAGAAPSARAVIDDARALSPPGTVAVVDDAFAAVVADGWDAVGPAELLAGVRGMAFALPGAVAVALARPGRRVVAFSSARGLERATTLTTIARLRLPVTIVAFDDGSPPAASALARAREAGLAATAATSARAVWRPDDAPALVVVPVARASLAATAADQVV